MSDVRDPETDQPLPQPNGNEYIQHLVIEDLGKRLQHGIRKYGTGLQANNGRDMLQDAYEECLDLAVYLRGALEERRARVTVPVDPTALIVLVDHYRKTAGHYDSDDGVDSQQVTEAEANIAALAVHRAR